jgi:hypothetical protein
MSSSTPASSATGNRSTPSRSAARATASASIKSDLPRSRPPRRAPAISLVATLTTRSPLTTKNRSNEPETCRQSSSAHTRSPAKPRAQSSAAANPSIANRDRLLVHQLVGTRTDRSDRVRALVHVRTEHDHDPRPFTRPEADYPADMACWGRCHAPIKSRRDIPDRRRATQRKPVRPTGRQRESESARRRSEPLRETGRHRPHPNSKRGSSSPIPLATPRGAPHAAGCARRLRRRARPRRSAPP